MRPNRLRGYLDALGVLVCEVIGLVLLWRAATFLGTVDFPHFGTWLKTTSPVGALTALVRLLGIVVFGWLLMSTLLYGAAVLSGKRSMITQSRRITLPLLRRVVDSLAAASVAASTLGNVGAVAGAMPSPPRHRSCSPSYGAPYPYSHEGGSGTLLDCSCEQYGNWAAFPSPRCRKSLIACEGRGRGGGSPKCLAKRTALPDCPGAPKSSWSSPGTACLCWLSGISVTGGWIAKLRHSTGVACSRTAVPSLTTTGYTSGGYS